MIVSYKQLGNCWSPARFCGGRCARVMTCTYPEKTECKAVTTEIKYLDEQYKARLEQINQSRNEALKTLASGR